MPNERDLPQSIIKELKKLGVPGYNLRQEKLEESDFDRSVRLGAAIHLAQRDNVNHTFHIVACMQ